MSRIRVDNLETTGGISVYPAKAWITYDQNTSSIIQSQGFSSITDLGTGKSLLSMSNAAPHIYYSVSTMACIPSNSSGNSSGVVLMDRYTSAPTTTDFRISQLYNSGSTFWEPNYCTAVVYW